MLEITKNNGGIFFEGKGDEGRKFFGFGERVERREREEKGKKEKRGEREVR